MNAEDPENDFMPSPGVITKIHVPGGHGIRWDSHVYQGYEISPYYDSMFGKLIAWEATGTRLSIGCWGRWRRLRLRIKHNVGFHKRVLNDLRFRAGDYSTHFLEQLARKPEPLGNCQILGDLL